MVQGIERRRFVRVTVDIPATVQLLGQGAGGPEIDPGYERMSISTVRSLRNVDATVRDLSVNGAQVVAPVAPPLMAQLSLSFPLPGYGMALAMCVVLWRREAGQDQPPAQGPGQPALATFGVMFEAVDLEVRRTIADIVARSQEKAPTGSG